MTVYEVDGVRCNHLFTLDREKGIQRLLDAATTQLVEIFTSEAFRREIATMAPQTRAKGKRRRGQWWVR